jgi:hypothetical protein
MAPDELLGAIESARSLRDFVEASLLKRVPWIFQGNEALFISWRQTIAREASVNGDEVYLVGSAATGYSLSPDKPGRDFRPTGSTLMRPSDIDIAVVDSRLFESGWNTVLRFDGGGRLSRLIREAYQYEWDRVSSDIQEMRRNVYWGSISHVYAFSGTQFARVLRLLFAATTRSKPFVGHPPKARIYRRREDLVNYHEQSLRSTKQALIRLRGIQ